MVAGRANAMSAPVLLALRSAIAEARTADAIVIKGDGRVFSAGLALPDLIDLDRASLGEFIDLFGSVMMDVLTSPVPTVAAIDGPAVAGGCVLALMCDLRVIGDTAGPIGLNEVRLGLGLPSVVVAPLRARVAGNAAVPIALGGELFQPPRALKLGLVDELVGSDSLESTALARAAALAGSPTAYEQIKTSLLGPVVEEITRNSAAERERWLDTWFGPLGRQMLSEVVARLRDRTNK